MKLLRRNLTEFEYLPYVGGETDIDPETGLHTGEYHGDEETYGEPVWYEGNLSTPSLYESATLYGSDLRYTHMLLIDDPEAEINEYGLIRVDSDLYDIRAIRRSLNSVSIALKKRTVDHAEEWADADGEDTGETGEDEPEDDGTDSGGEEP